ncbi:MAG TPA: nucleotidyltransferase domain-containing protein [Candidatus Brocadiia bacterium]|nr:nucleotidyltransferase domain-containing protein [Planctomycetota bacterium]MDO8094594.1 nucleotidyltransferase domain-containing protein [Candidatus Brocadiales bacterium]
MKLLRPRKEIERILPRIREIVEKIYGNRLIDVFLYGSFARNRATKESDIDIAVLLKGKVDKVKELDRLCDALYDLELESGELISVNPLSEEEIEDLEWPLHYHIKTDGIRI